jgi:hypothetical protein
MLMSEKRPLNGSGTVFQLAPPDVTGKENVFDVTAQYSRLRLSVAGPAIGEFKSGAEFVGMFYNGQVLNDQYGFTPALAFAYLANDHWNISVGRRMELFSDRQPTMVDEISVLGASGNPGNSMRTQVRVENYSQIFDKAKLTLAVAASDPISTSVSSSFSDRSEDNGRPNIEGKASIAIGPSAEDDPLKRPAFELGVSVVDGEFRKFTGLAPPFAAPKIVHVGGVAVDFGTRLGSRFGIQGEVYKGQALGNYMGSAFQTVNSSSLREISSLGGWVEANWYWSQMLSSNIGFGQDQNNKLELAAGQTSLNRTLYMNTIWQVSPFWQVSGELTKRRTDYLQSDGGLFSNDGYGFMMATQFKY